MFWLVLPIISLISYLYVHGDGIAQRTFDRSSKGQAALDTYDRPTDHNRSAAAQIERLEMIDSPQQGRFTRTGRAEYRGDGPGRQGEVDALEHVNVAE